VFETFSPCPFYWIGSGLTVEFLAVTGPCFFADELAALEMPAIIAVGINELALVGFFLKTSALASMMANVGSPLPV
jgi:hypothetical protein